jgi:hypothetical protein
MTREEIIKGLECCYVPCDERDCNPCPVGFGHGCALKLKREAVKALKKDVPDINVGDIRFKQDAIDAIDKEADKLESSGAIPQSQWLRAARFIVEALPSAQPEQRWIPCSEMLPETCMSVMTCSDSGEIYINSYNPKSPTGWAIGHWEVIAWMPLPKPYQAERRTDD